MAKTTLATVKSFLRKNKGKVYIATKSHFDGMVDCVMPCGDKTFVLPNPEGPWHENELGIHGAWFVFGSRDWITPFEKDGMRGFEVYNCCGSFELAVKV